MGSSCEIALRNEQKRRIILIKAVPRGRFQGDGYNEDGITGDENDEEEDDSTNVTDPRNLIPPEIGWDDVQLTNADLIAKNIDEMRRSSSGKSEISGEFEEEVVQDAYLGIVHKTPVKKSSKKLGAGSPRTDENDSLAQVYSTSSLPASVEVTADGAEEVEEEEEEDDDGVEYEYEEAEEEEEFEEEEVSSLGGADVYADEDDADPSYRTSLQQLLERSGVVPSKALEDWEGRVEISGIQHDSRLVVPGDLFICCTGLRSDGHQFAAQALERGAAAILATDSVPLQLGLSQSATSSTPVVVRVPDSSACLPGVASSFYGRPSEELLVVGVTGTNGKTTTSWLIHSMYTAMGLRAGLLGTIHHSIAGKEIDSVNTTPDAVEVQKLMAAMIHKKCEACVMEVSSHALALGRVRQVDVDVAVFTNLTRDHMDFHQSEEEYREAKLTLFDGMRDPDRHRKVVNIDDPSAPFFLGRGNPLVPVVTFSLDNEDADVYPLRVALSLFETELVVRTPKGILELSSGLLGRHNVSNILAAIAVGIAIEAPLEDVVRGIEDLDSVPGRCELIDEEQAFAVLVDYAHTPDALGRLLDTVRECGANRIITVVGCGGDRDKGKRPIMCKTAVEKSDVTILTSDNPRSEEELDIIDDMLAGIGMSMDAYLKLSNAGYIPALPNGKRVYVSDIRGIAVRAAVAMGEEGDAVVVAGKGHETHQIVKDEKIYFDDREECREALTYADDVRSYFDTSEIPWKLLDKAK